MISKLLKFCIFFQFALLTLLPAEQEDKTVLLAILARNKAHVLPKFLDCIDKLDYDKKLISVYINTNNNEDKTKEILQSWADKNAKNYRHIIFKSHDVKNISDSNPHDWTAERLFVLGCIRNESLQKAKIYNCDYYFVVDCDNFIIPTTLKDLVKKDKPIIAPMLIPVPEKDDVYSNYFCAVDEYGYYAQHQNYEEIFFRRKVGTFEVPVVHCTYLIKTPIIDQLTYVDGYDDYEFVIFSRTARERGIKQYICNEDNYGFLIHFYDDPSLEVEQERVAKLSYLKIEDKSRTN